MLVHLSKTSPYVCDLSRGPIEEANRMASAPTKKATALLEQKESFPKVTRTPLKLLAPEEIPMDTTATATDINSSLQPVWYTEQTIVDEQSVQIEEQQQGRSSLHPRSTLPTIQSESPSIPEDDEELPAQPSLMHKSSTFTIEPSMTLETRLEELEKENSTNQPIAPSDDSFRALEQLLGLGSGSTIRDSPKTSHDTLSLTVVTPTDIINSTSTSIRMSIATKTGADSLPSSQELTTIESINSINPPSFLMENTTMEVDQTSTTLNQDEPSSTMNQDKLTDSSGDETNFSFELNDFSNESTNNIQAAPVAPVPVPSIRAPTCTDVAFRALLKARKGGRISQPVKADSPLAQPSKGRSSAPTARMLRSSCRRISTEAAAEATTTDEQTTTPTECFVDDGKTEFVEMVTLNEEDEVAQEKSASLTLNMSTPPTAEVAEVDGGEQNVTPPKPMIPELSREYTYDTPKRRSSARGRSMLNSTYGTPMQQNTNQEDEGNNSMLNILLTKPTEIPVNIRKSARNSPAITSKSMLNVLLTQQPTENETPVTTPIRTPNRETTNSPAIPSQSMLEVLLTQPTEPKARTPKRKTNSIASKSMLNVLLTQPTEAKARTPKRKTNSVASKSMLNVLLTQPTEAKPQTPKRKTNSIASKSMLNVLLTQPTTDNNQTEEIIPTEQLESSPSVPSKSMLGILLTQETGTNTEPSVIQESPAIPSRSMLNVLLTNPTEDIETPILEETLPVQPSNTRQSRRSTAQTTPRGSINPLHSSTPSAPRSKSLQIVSIGEEEQVSTIVPQQQEIEIVNLNQTNEAIQQTIARTLEMGVQTTPSIDISTRRRVQTLEPQTTPSTSMIVANEDKPITPLQTKVIVNLQRRVCFQLTPTTDARLAEKEKLEEALRGLKPDIVIEPTPIEIAPQPVEKVKKAPAKKAPAKPKKKVVASKAKKAKEIAAPAKRTTRKAPAPKVAQPVKRAPSKEKPAKRTHSKEKPAAAPTKRAQSKEKPAKRTQSKEKPAVAQPTKRAASKEKPAAPTKRVPSKENSTKRSQSKEKPPVPPASKRTSRKRTIEQVKEKPVVETTVKRVRNSKSVDLPPPVPKAQPIKQEKPIAQSVERPSRTRSRSTNNQKRNSQLKTTTTPVVRTSKRRLESVDKTESTKKKVEEIAKPVAVAPKVETNNDERQKLESLTVAQLKTRLNTHKANIPKNAKKADLIALLIQQSTNLKN